MRRIAITAACAAGIGAVIVAAAGATQAASITPTSIAGAKLGLPASAYKHLFGTPFRTELAPGGGPFTRLVFTKRKVAVYFWNGGDHGIEVITWNKADRSATGIGPCSSIARLKAAYGSKVKPLPSSTINGAVYVYQAGQVLFAANGKPPHPTTHVTAVAVYSAPLFHDPKAPNYAGFFILSTPNC
jgi:hypothetical protein